MINRPLPPVPQDGGEKSSVDVAGSVFGSSIGKKRLDHILSSSSLDESQGKNTGEEEDVVIRDKVRKKKRRPKNKEHESSSEEEKAVVRGSEAPNAEVAVSSWASVASKPAVEVENKEETETTAVCKDVPTPQVVVAEDEVGEVKLAPLRTDKEGFTEVASRRTRRISTEPGAQEEEVSTWADVASKPAAKTENELEDEPSRAFKDIETPMVIVLEDDTESAALPPLKTDEEGFTEVLSRRTRRISARLSESHDLEEHEADAPTSEDMTGLADVASERAWQNYSALADAEALLANRQPEVPKRKNREHTYDTINEADAKAKEEPVYATIPDLVASAVQSDAGGSWAAVATTAAKAPGGEGQSGTSSTPAPTSDKVAVVLGDAREEAKTHEVDSEGFEPVAAKRKRNRTISKADTVDSVENKAHTPMERHTPDIINSTETSRSSGPLRRRSSRIAARSSSRRRPG